MSTPLLLLPPPASADVTDSVSVLVLPLFAPLILLTGSLKVGAAVLIVAELVAVVKICVAEVSPRHLHGDAASDDIS